MAESTTEAATADTTTSATESATTATTGDATTEAPAEKVVGEEALGDAGKKALDAMKAKWKAADTLAKESAATVAAVQAKLDGQEAEHAAETAAQKIRDEALAGANQRILKAEVRAAAAAKLADPADALRFIDLSEFEVGSDGEVDSSAIAQAITDLIASKPYLAAQGGPKFTGTADGGARNDASKASQLGRGDMSSMSPEQIEEARAAGRFDNLMAGK